MEKNWVFGEQIPADRPLAQWAEELCISPRLLGLLWRRGFRTRAAMALCEKHHDYQSRDLLLAQLKDTEEDHAYWLEKQLGLIQMLGLSNYLQSQIGTGAAA